VLTSPGHEETTLLYYDAAREKLVFDATESGALGRRVVEEAPLVVPDGEGVTLRVFLDNSVVEVFVNDRQAITRRVYPERDDSDRVFVFCRGGAAVFSGIETWEIMPSNAW
jgi:beta-fructofuranosidase